MHDRFIQRLAPLQQGAARLSPAGSFFAGTLLIHEYRRVLLRDPNLPVALLPDDWPGLQARRLCEALYANMLAASEQFLRDQVQTPDGMLARTPGAITRRSNQPQGRCVGSDCANRAVK